MKMSQGKFGNGRGGRKAHRGMLYEDATEPFYLVVAKEHIAKGVSDNPERCAIARALEDVPGLSEWHVYKTTASMVFQNTDQMVQRRYDLPSSARLQVYNFDTIGTMKMKPGVYRLDPVSPSNRRESKKKYSAARRKRLQAGYVPRRIKRSTQGSFRIRGGANRQKVANR